MTVAKCAIAAIALSIVAGVTASAQAQTTWRGWQGSSVNSPNRDFIAAGAPSGAYASYGADAGCYQRPALYRDSENMPVYRMQTVCP